MKMSGGLLKGIGAAAAVGALLMFGLGAAAQDTKRAPAAKAAAPKAAAKPASACKGLDEVACKAKEAECSWIGAITTKAGKPRRAYCRARPKAAAKKAK